MTTQKRKDYMRKWREKNSEKIKGYRLIHKEAHKKSTKKWRVANKDRVKAVYKEWAANNKQSRQISNKKYWIKHKDDSGFKKARLKWKHTNIEKVRLWGRIYVAKTVAEVQRPYIFKLTGIPTKHITEEFLEVKRLHLLIKRKLKEVKHENAK